MTEPTLCPDCGQPKDHPAKICPCSGYYEKLDEVARCLYSLDFHYCRYADAHEAERVKYRRKAHLARVWWGLRLDGSINSESPDAKLDTEKSGD